MCPFNYLGKCILLENRGTFAKFEIYCSQDKEWQKELDKLPNCPFRNLKEAKSCSHKNMYQDWVSEEKVVSRLENKGF